MCVWAVRVCVCACARVRVCAGRTLGRVATRAILHQDVVEGLVDSVGQLMNPHGGDPLLAHGAIWVPAVNHTVITRPGEEEPVRHCRKASHNQA